MYPVLFSIGNINFYTHGLLIAIGSLIGGYLVFILAKKQKLETGFIYNLLIGSLFIGLIGARLTYIISYFYQFSSWTEMFSIWNGGLVSFGGIVFGYLFAYIYLKKKHAPVREWLDIGTIGFLFGWAFGRIGCYLTGDTPGLFSLSWIAINNEIPVALFEAGWSFILGSVLLYLFLKKNEKLKKLGSGAMFFIGIIFFMIGRFFIDFYRDDVVVFIGLSFGQIAALLAILLILVYLSLNKIKLRRRKNA